MNGIQPLNIPITTGRPFHDNSFAGGTVGSGSSFQDILNRRISENQPLTFSKHAQARTEQRGIALSDTDMTKLDDAIGMAKNKGLTDTLVFMNNTAFIVNVPSKTVVTVMDNAETGGNVFTNIDGAVIV